MPSLELYAENPNDKALMQVSNSLLDGGIAICPTDTLYAFVCVLSNKAGIEKICKLVGKKPEKAQLSIICSDLKHISDYTHHFDKNTYKLINRNLPGPFTFILRANNKIPKLFLNKRKSIGIRVPDSKISQLLVEQCGQPLVAASVHNPEQREEYLNEISEMEHYFGKQVDWIIDAGRGELVGSAVIDCSGEQAELIREGPQEVI